MEYLFAIEIRDLKEKKINKISKAKIGTRVIEVLIYKTHVKLNIGGGTSMAVVRCERERFGEGVMREVEGFVIQSYYFN